MYNLLTKPINPKIMRYVLLVLISVNALSEPWLDVSDSSYVNDINHKLKTCNHSGQSYISYPVSYGEINFYLEKIEKDNSNNALCKKNITNIKLYLRNKFIKTREVILGIQSGANDEYFQIKSNRYFKNDNVYFSFSNITSNFAYKLKVINTDQGKKNYFDESYIAYKYKNHIFTTGRINRWWSPSDSYSLILSNSARPSIGIEYKNYTPIKFENILFKFLGNINYEFFVNKLEEERVIPNTLLFGNRVTFKPHDSFKLSLVRIAQFGGRNRPKDLNTILKMLIGKDNTSPSLSFEEQPGNQLAGFDFIYNPRINSNLKLYGQMIGEDEAGYFPSRKMSLFGFSYFIDNQYPMKLSIDVVDTFSGIKNYSYNHALYQSGLRYYGLPIGASIDADSEAIKFSLNKKYNALDLQFSFSDIILNKNNSLLNYWTKQKTDFNQFELLVKYKYKKSYIDLIYTYRDLKFNNSNKNNLFVNLYFKF